MLINLEAPIRRAVATATGPGTWTTHTALVTGQRTHATLVEHDGRLQAIEVLLTPEMAYRVFGPPVGDIGGGAVSPEDLLGPAGARLVAMLGDAWTWRERFARLDRWLLNRAWGGAAVDRQVHGAWRELLRTGGTLPVRQLALLTGWSERHLANRFRAQLGILPKQAARIVRIQRTLKLLQAGADPASVVAAHGFCDQSHFTREFKAMAGQTHRAFVRSRLRGGCAAIPVDRLDGAVTSAVLPLAPPEQPASLFSYTRHGGARDPRAQEDTYWKDGIQPCATRS
ncbi:AraC family transcriptional regulator [Kitasatospora sp. NPDC093558]|uniref:helix-turn-helix domain-containing protein n=1 Tax=Kitasatospora sp. NPDC093558 TaxID=3155201 RepID=UPI00343E6E14